jgi:transcriptional regulator with XRE-family HTH domain
MRKPSHPRYPVYFLKEYRLARGLTQQQVAAQFPCSHASVQRWENGLQRIGLDVLDRMSLILRASRGDLMERPPQNAMKNKN